MQDINHRYELRDLSDEKLQATSTSCHNSIAKASANAKIYYIERRNMANKLIAERKEQRMYLACLEQ